jgi:hypothetical protein
MLKWLLSELYDKAQIADSSDFWIYLSDLHSDYPNLLDRLVQNLGSDELIESELFSMEWQRLIPLVISNDKLILPSQSKETDSLKLAHKFFNGSLFSTLLSTVVQYRIPEKARSEHTHILGGSGHGKTELLKLLICDDLMEAIDTDRSVIVIDSQGDMIKSLLSLPFFDPSSGPLTDRLIIIDPNDIDIPPALNLFALATDAKDKLIREKKIQSAVALYEYLFGELLGAEMTQRQGTLFSYLARLMVEIPLATIHTLKDVLEHGERYKPHMNKLSGSAKDFFETRFFDPSFKPVKSQIINRLWGILSTGTLDRMFSGSEMRIDFAHAFQSGKIIFVNTAKELLKSEASSFFGRFILSLISHSIIERAGIREADRLPVSIYVDEAHEYLDPVMAELFSQSRKYGVSLTIAHQNLDQLDTDLRSSIASSTSVKIAGGLSNKDARAMASDMNCAAEFIGQRRKTEGNTEFALYVRNHLNQATTLHVPLGLTAKRETLDDDDLEQLYEVNRKRYGRRITSALPVLLRPVLPLQPPLEQPASIPKVSSETWGMTKSEGKGGQEHIYLQSLIKHLGQEAGYLSQIEKEIVIQGKLLGYVDVLLQRDMEIIAIEIAISTDVNYEIGNIQKCLKLNPSKVLIVSPDKKHLDNIQKLSQQKDITNPIIHFITPDQLASHIFKSEIKENPDYKIVKGYKVKVTHSDSQPLDLLERKRRIAGVLAGNMLPER